MNQKLRSMLTRLPPVRWFRALENGMFRMASEAEYRLRITPRTTKIVPNTFDRRMVRLFLIVVPVLISTFLVDARPMRARVLFVILVLAALALACIFVADAFPTKRPPPPRPPMPRPLSRPTASRTSPPPPPPARRM